MTLDAVNERLMDDQSLASICKQLYLDYEAKNEAKQQSGLISKMMRQNPMEKKGAIKMNFFQSRKSLFTSNSPKLLVGLKAKCSDILSDEAGESSAASGPVHVAFDSTLDYSERNPEKVQDAGAAQFHGIHLAQGWQEWTTPNGRKYYFHPETQVSQWEPPLEDRAGKEALQPDDAGNQNDVHIDKGIHLRDLELALVAILQHKELDLDQINKGMAKEPSICELVKKLSDYGGKRRGRDLGLERKECTVKKDFFDSRPHIFKTRVKGSRVFVSLVTTSGGAKSKR